MNTVFADSGYWLALLNPRDQLHQRAIDLSGALGPSFIVTSEMVLTEVLNGLAGNGQRLRRAAVELVEKLQSDPNVAIIPQSSLQFKNALRLYAQRYDKPWGQTDCSSFLIMQARRITEALAYDRHFSQAGFQPLLAATE